MHTESTDLFKELGLQVGSGHLQLLEGLHPAADLVGQRGEVGAGLGQRREYRAGTEARKRAGTEAGIEGWDRGENTGLGQRRESRATGAGAAYHSGVDGHALEGLGTFKVNHLLASNLLKILVRLETQSCTNKLGPNA